ncbi:MAG: hypothetical protein H6810_08725 [Phycisphaeraceae bacterium]|nr:MAG: hypothetical protein H6810_08725 [Phycisphaeraceae bacterium]
MPVDPVTTPATRTPGEVILTDRPCYRCGYNLRGLETGGLCPECGAPITVRKKSVRFADGLVDAPMWYIQLVALASVLMALVVVGTIAGFVAALVGAVPAFVINGLFTILAGVWFASAWLVTFKRPHGERTLKDVILDSRPMQIGCRATQGTGLAVVVMMWAFWASGFGVFVWLAGLLMLGVLFGLVPFGIYLSSLADWSGDTGVGSRLRSAVWCIAVCGTLLVAVSVVEVVGIKLGLLGLVKIPLSILVLVGVGLFGWSVIQLAISAVWAIQNSHEANERSIRMEEKRRERAARDAARAEVAAASIAAANAAREAEMDERIPDSIPLSGGGEKAKEGPAKPAPEAHGIKHHKSAEFKTPPPESALPKREVDPYELEPDEEEP